MEDPSKIIDSLMREDRIAFSELTPEQRAHLLKSSNHNKHLFEIYVDFRRRLDAEVDKHVAEGTDLILSPAEMDRHIDVALDGRDINLVGEAITQAHSGTTAHLTTVAKVVARRMIGRGSESPFVDSLIETLLKGRKES